jgi:hypothetical protein
MALTVESPCPGCGLILVFGAIFDETGQAETYGPILGLHKDAMAETAIAGYVGISSLWLADQYPDLYRCPGCKCNPLTEINEPPSGHRVGSDS